MARRVSSTLRLTVRLISGRKTQILQPKPVISLHNHPLLCRPIATTVLCYQKEVEDEGGPATPAREKMEGERGHKPLKVDWETSAAYMNSEAYYDVYGDEPVWKPYRRNFPGQFAPETRKTCIRGKTGEEEISTGSACPICRDDYLVIHYKNIKLLKQLVREETGEPYPTKRTGLCQKQQRRLEVELAKAIDYGYMETVVPFRSYDYDEYRKILAQKKQPQKERQKSSLS